MKIKKYATEEVADQIRQAIVEAEGHCPCILTQFRCADTKCMCKEFRDAPKGTICQCGLYIKIEE